MPSTVSEEPHEVAGTSGKSGKSEADEEDELAYLRTMDGLLAFCEDETEDNDELQQAKKVAAEAEEAAAEADAAEEPLSIEESLLQMQALYSASDSLVQMMLDALNSNGVQVPKSIYLLKKQHLSSEAVADVRRLTDGGEFAYEGIGKNLSFCLKRGLIDFCQLTFDSSVSGYRMRVRINMDGLPLYNSSGLEAWPILMLFDGINRPMPIALYVGRKPQMETYLVEFNKELQEFIHHGLEVGGKRFIASQVSITAFMIRLPMPMHECKCNLKCAFMFSLKCLVQ
jgi:hypothetical protein